MQLFAMCFRLIGKQNPIIMKKFIVFAVAALLVSSCIWKQKTKSRLRPLPVANEEVGVKYFKSISAAGGVDIVYVQGTRNFIKFEGPESSLKHYGFDVEGEKLHIAPRDNVFKTFMGAEDVKIIVSSTDLVEVNIAGSGEFLMETPLDTDNLRVKVAGSGDVDLSDVICNNISCDIAGSGDIKVRSVTTGNALLSIAGSGDIEMNFKKCGFVKTKIAGSGDIKLKGKTEHFDSKIAGSGTVDTSELITN